MEGKRRKDRRSCSLPFFRDNSNTDLLLSTGRSLPFNVRNKRARESGLESASKVALNSRSVVPNALSKLVGASTPSAVAAADGSRIAMTFVILFQAFIP